jgi:hypothetical protein
MHLCVLRAMRVDDAMYKVVSIAEIGGVGLGGPDGGAEEALRFVACGV